MAKKLQVEYIPIDELQTYENNAKLHPAEQVEQIKKSIQQYGMNDPIAVWKDNVIIEGHGRLIALKELEFDEVPIIRLDSLTDEQRREYALIHNKTTMNSGFDFSLLDLELEWIQDNDMEFNPADFGFDISVNDYVDDFFVEGQEPNERAGDYDEEHKFVVYTHKRGKYDALTTYLKKNEYEYEIDG